jgi:hypothetical protein
MTDPTPQSDLPPDAGSTPQPDLPADTGGGGLRWQPIVLVIAGGMLVAALFIHKRNKRLEKLEKEGGGGTTANKVWQPNKPEIKPEEWPFKGKFLGSWVALLKDPDKNVRRETATTLSGIEPEGTPHLTPLVLKLLGDEDADVRALAVYILGNIKPDPASVLTPLGTALNDQDKRVRQAAAKALGNIRGEPAAMVQILAPALRDKDKNIRREAAMALVQVGRTNPDALGPLLKETLADKDPDVRQLAKYIQQNTKAAIEQPKPTPETPRDLIVGKWTDARGGVGKSVVEEYTRDGAYLTHLLGQSMSMGKYKFVDNDTMELTLSLKGLPDGQQATVKYRVKVTWNDLVLTPIDVPQPVERKFKRVK